MGATPCAANMQLCCAWRKLPLLPDRGRLELLCTSMRAAAAALLSACMLACLHAGKRGAPAPEKDERLFQARAAQLVRRKLFVWRQLCQCSEHTGPHLPSPDIADKVTCGGAHACMGTFMLAPPLPPPWLKHVLTEW